jgi:hypothetical protein
MLAPTFHELTAVTGPKSVRPMRRHIVLTPRDKQRIKDIYQEVFGVPLPEDRLGVGRKDAKDRNLTGFFDAVLCEAHGFVERQTSNGGCIICRNERSIEWYKENTEAAVERSRIWRVSHPGYEAQRSRNWRISNPDKANNWHTKQPETREKRRARQLGKYNLTQEQFDATLAAQNYRCVICQTTEPCQQGWCVDHCSVSGKNRGLLCRRCNLFLGYGMENPDIFAAAAGYIVYHHELCGVTPEMYVSSFAVKNAKP